MILISNPSYPIHQFTFIIVGAVMRNVLVTPQIRSRFLRMEPGQESGAHTHDLGHEVFLVLEGRAEFTIDGETEEVGPGQMCVALVNQMHGIKVLGDEPMYMYLSVTPHIQPTHTLWTEDGRRLPYNFASSGSYGEEVDATEPFADLVDRFSNASAAVTEAIQSASARQSEQLGPLKHAVGESDSASASEARRALWETLSPLFERVNTLASVWNDLSARAGDTSY